MNTRPKNPANARNLNACVIGSSGSGKTRFWLTPQLLQAHSSYVFFYAFFNLRNLLYIIVRVGRDGPFRVG